MDEKKFYFHYRSLIIINSFLSMSQGLISPVFSVFVLHLHGNLKHIGELLSIYALMSTIVGFVIAKKLKHKAKVNLFVYSYFVSAMCSVALIFVSSIYQLYIIQAIFGICSAARTPGSTNLMTHTMSLRKQEPSVGWQIYRMIGKLLAAISAFAAGYLSHYYGFNLIFIIMAIFSFVAFALSFLDYKKWNEIIEHIERG